jgi:hypothetical protein
LATEQQLLAMSLNPSEQMVFDYIQRHPEERQYWSEKVRKTCAGFTDGYAAASALEADLWRYFEERSSVVSPFREVAQHQGVRRTSMKNLAEHLIRLWTPPKKKQASPSSAQF